MLNKSSSMISEAVDDDEVKEDDIDAESDTGVKSKPPLSEGE